MSAEIRNQSQLGETEHSYSPRLDTMNVARDSTVDETHSHQHSAKASDGEGHAQASFEAETDPKDISSPQTKSGHISNGKPSSEDTTPNSPTKVVSTARVSIVDHKQACSTVVPKPPSEGRLRMERELERMRQADENKWLRQKARRHKEMQKAIAAVRKGKEKEGVTLTADVEASRAAIRVILHNEERMALEKEQKKMRKETKALQLQIHDKYGLKDKKQGPDLVALAHSFHQGKVKDKDGIPEHVLRELTREEIEDLRMVFDMFDVKGKGYIIADDVRRAAGMLGFKAKKKVFSGMIEEVTGDCNGKVTFAHFLQFVVKGQGDGDDPLDAIQQCFRMLDQDHKGYLTADDLRTAAEMQKLPLSNRAIREMIQEADVTGDAKVTSDEFIHIMLQSSMFRTSH